MSNSLTVSTPSGAVTIATKPDLSPAGQPLVSVGLTVGMLTYPVRLSADEARRLARHLLDAANNAQVCADGYRVRSSQATVGA